MRERFELKESQYDSGQFTLYLQARGGTFNHAAVGAMADALLDRAMEYATTDDKRMVAHLELAKRHLPDVYESETVVLLGINRSSGWDPEYLFEAVRDHGMEHHDPEHDQLVSFETDLRFFARIGNSGTFTWYATLGAVPEDATLVVEPEDLTELAEE